MTTVDPPAAPASVTDRFITLIAPKQRTDKNGAPVERRVVEDKEFIQMLMRQARALEYRACQRPENLAQILLLVERFNEIINVAIAVNKERFDLDPMLGASQAECGNVLNVSKQAASKRAERGREIIARREAAAGAANFSEAKREREAIAEAARHAEQSMPEYQARHLRIVA